MTNKLKINLVFIFLFLFKFTIILTINKLKSKSLYVLHKFRSFIRHKADIINYVKRDKSKTRTADGSI